MTTGLFADGGLPVLGILPAYSLPQTRDAHNCTGPRVATLVTLGRWRIYVACTLRASGADNDMIHALLRWKPSSSLHIYARLHPEVYGSWLMRITNIDTTFAQTMGLPDLSPDGVAATLGPLAQLAALNFE